MTDYPIIDTHTHTFPTKEIARQAIQRLPYPGASGVVEDLLADLAAAGFVKAVMLNFTPTGEMREENLVRQPANSPPARWGEVEERVRQMIVDRVRRRNAWTLGIAEQHPALVPFIGLDPLMGEEGMLTELDACIQNGARGIKFHCSTQRSYPTDRRLWVVYSRAQERGLPIVFHSGWHPLGCHLSDYARPARFAEIAEAFPRLAIVLAHIGLGWQTEAVALARRFPNVWFDSCLAITGTWTPPPLSDGEITSLLRLVGVDRVMFASDWPLCVPAKERQRAETLPLGDSEKRLLFYENAQRILKL
ncbi:MAG: amidohydrolase [Candidatus Rokubacteria bacterium]|nr:amidohydrolase [Candidatus Rokubacteria bacterium]